MSTTAIQSLQLLNSQLSLSAARHLRDRLLRDRLLRDGTGNAGKELIANLFKLAYCREPSEQELQYLVDKLPSKGLTTDETVQTRLLTICIAVLNANEFIYID